MRKNHICFVWGVDCGLLLLPGEVVVDAFCLVLLTISLVTATFGNPWVQRNVSGSVLACPCLGLETVSFGLPVSPGVGFPRQNVLNPVLRVKVWVHLAHFVLRANMGRIYCVSLSRKHRFRLQMLFDLSIFARADLYRLTQSTEVSINRMALLRIRLQV